MQVSSGGGLAKAVFGGGFFLKELLLRLGVTSLPGVDDVVFGKIKARLGGRVRIIVSGGAPLAAHVEHFLKVTMCCPVTQVRRPPLAVFEARSSNAQLYCVDAPAPVERHGTVRRAMG